MSNVLSVAVDLIYPRSCAACNAHVETEPGLICWDCIAGFDYVTQPFCTICGDPVDGVVDREYTCSYCIHSPPHFHRARSAIRHKGKARAVLHAFKYQRLTALTADLVAMLVACVGSHYQSVGFDAVVCVPLHRSRQRQRAYNQSHLLAKSLARRLGLSFLSACLERVRVTETQTGLSGSARRKNVMNAFVVGSRFADWVDGRRILLVDDVMTTGSTVNECARILKKAGAAGVYVATVARG